MYKPELLIYYLKFAIRMLFVSSIFISIAAFLLSLEIRLMGYELYLAIYFFAYIICPHFSARQPCHQSTSLKRLWYAAPALGVNSNSFL
jgi:hypothetical protein